jgi:hypothetical protein
MSDLRLPDHIANLFRAYAEQDSHTLLDTFAPDGTLIDEGREWHGVAEIRGWDEQNPAPRSSIEPTESATNAVDTQRTATVTGTFPGCDHAAAAIHGRSRSPDHEFDDRPLASSTGEHHA